MFNTYLKEKFLTKRFGIEGCDSFISGLDNLSDKAAQSGVGHIVIGMAHRGRLNTLAYVLNKPLEEIMAEFQDMKGKAQNEGVWGGAGDVKYHLGVSVDRSYGDKKVNMVLILPSKICSPAQQQRTSLPRSARPRELICLSLLKLSGDCSECFSTCWRANYIQERGELAAALYSAKSRYRAALYLSHS